MIYSNSTIFFGTGDGTNSLYPLPASSLTILPSFLITSASYSLTKAPIGFVGFLKASSFLSTIVYVNIVQTFGFLPAALNLFPKTF